MAFQGDSIFWVEVEKIVPNPFQPRREFDEEKLRELGDSIRMYGVLQPLTVTRKEVHRDDGTFFTEYELIAGERRLRASKLANVEQVPVIIRSGEQTEQEKLELAIIENLQREDLNAVDRALAFKQLADTFDLSFTQVAKKVGRSREYVSNSVRLLALPDHILESVKRAEITEGHGRTLLMLKDRPEELEVVYREILLKKLSVREVERIARKIASDKVRKKSWVNTNAHLIEMEREFTDTLGTRVQISKTDYGGKLTIDYFTESELEKLLHVIKSQRTLLEQADNDTVSETNIQELADAESALAALTKSTPLQAEVTAEPNTTPDASNTDDMVSSTTPVTPTADTDQAEEVVPATEPTHLPTDTDQVTPTDESEPAVAANAVTPLPDTTPTPAPVSEESVVTATTAVPSPAPEPMAPPTPAPADTPVPEATSEADAVAQDTPRDDISPVRAATASQQGSNEEEEVTNSSTPPVTRSPRVVAIFNERKTYLTDVVDVAAKAPHEVPATSAEPTPDTDSQKVTESVDQSAERTVSDDEDLYSINRFSI